MHNHSWYFGNRLHWQWHLLEEVLLPPDPGGHEDQGQATVVTETSLVSLGLG